MNFWIDEAPKIAPRGETVCLYSRSGRPLFNMPRSVALVTGRRLLSAVADLDDRPPKPPIQISRKR